MKRLKRSPARESLLAIPLLFVVSCGTPSIPTPPPTPPAPAAETTAVTLQVVKLDRLDQELASLRGKIVVMDIWGEF